MNLFQQLGGVVRGPNWRAAEDRGDPGSDPSGGSIWTPVQSSSASFSFYDAAITSLFAGPPPSPARPSLTVEAQEETIRAWKHGKVMWSPGGKWYFAGGFGKYIAETEVAECRAHRGNLFFTPKFMPEPEKPPAHEAPGEGCSCGFYGWADKPGPEDQYGGALLEVEFFGRVVVAERGFRAQKQRVLALHLPHCDFCADPVVNVVLRKAETREDPVSAKFRCREHTRLSRADAKLPVEHLSNLLTTEVRFS